MEVEAGENTDPEALFGSQPTPIAATDEEAQGSCVDKPAGTRR